MITLHNICLRRGASILLENIDWTIFHKQHIGLIGENGSGKSSLFAMLLNQLQPDQGDLEIPRQLKFAHLAQETPGHEQSALEFVLDGDTELRTLQKALQDAEDKNDGTRIANMHDALGKIDAYTANARAAQLLAGLGFSHEEQQKSVKDFSGGWRVRLNLAKALMCPSDVLLLDEPTNHLDLDAILWLEQWLIKYPGTLLLISHDREFLDHTVDHIAHISGRQLKSYSGNYSAFEKQRAAQLLLQQAAYEKQQQHIAHLQSFVNRFRAKATKARQAQSRMKAIERLELISAVQVDSPFQFQFKEPKTCPNPLICLEDASVGYGNKIILKGIHLSIAPKDRIGILGPNGAGKSSLIKLLAGELPVHEGIRKVAAGLKIGYFAQHQIDHLRLAETPFQHFRDIAPTLSESESRKYLGNFGFSGDRVFERVSIFSGGEKSRLALALLIWQEPNLLLLDEPTNHLDLEMRQALNIALQEYEGAVILVSHDRFLVRTTADQLMLVAEEKITPFEGDLDDYQRWLFQFRSQTKPSQIEKTENSKKSQRQQAAKERESRRPLEQKIKKLESTLILLEKELFIIETALTDSALYEPKNKKELQKLLLSQAKIRKEIEEVERDWLEASGS